MFKTVAATNYATGANLTYLLMLSLTSFPFRYLLRRNFWDTILSSVSFINKIGLIGSAIRKVRLPYFLFSCGWQNRTTLHSAYETDKFTRTLTRYIVVRMGIEPMSSP